MNFREMLESCGSEYQKFGACYRNERGEPAAPPEAHRKLVESTLLPMLQDFCRVKTIDNDENIPTAIPTYFSGSDKLHGWLFDNKDKLHIEDEDIRPLLITTSIRFGQEMLSGFNPTRRDVQEMVGDKKLAGTCPL